MTKPIWEPFSPRPDDLVPASRVDDAGETGPTRKQARGPRWHRCAPGLYVPAQRPRHVEQRILEQGARVDPARGAVTAWAALRWHGATFFDGRVHGDDDVLPVPLLLGGGNSRPHPASVTSKAQLAPYDRERVSGLWVTTARRALFDEVVRLRPDLWASVAAIDMTYAAKLVKPHEFSEYLSHRCAWEGVPHVREAAALARADLRSPREAWLDLVWRLVARLPLVPANVPVFALDGTFLAMPDLLDLEAGLAVEYDGEHHLRAVQRKKDVEREALLRRHGLEYVTTVRGDTREVAAGRILEARARSPFTPPAERLWTTKKPAWWSARHPTDRPA